MGVGDSESWRFRLVGVGVVESWLDKGTMWVNG